MLNLFLSLIVHLLAPNLKVREMKLNTMLKKTKAASSVCDSHLWSAPGSICRVYTVTGLLWSTTHIRVWAARIWWARCNLFSVGKNSIVLRKQYGGRSLRNNTSEESFQTVKHYLYAASQHLVKNVCPLFHETNILCCRVGTLAVLDGVNETVPELFQWPQQVLLDEVDHAMVWQQQQFSVLVLDAIKMYNMVC